MAEEETGFTFVDKRRLAPEAAPEVVAEPLPVASETPAADTVESRAFQGSQAFQSQVFENQTLEPQNSEDLLNDADLDDPEAAGGTPTTYDMIGYCINLLASQAWQKLGLLADPQTGEAQPDFVEAKVAIDAVSDLAARLDAAPETVIPADLRRDLRTLVNDLRLNYVSQRGPSA